MATSSNPTVQSSVGENLEVVKVLEHKRTKDSWDYYDLCEMSYGSKMARCKYCLRFFAPETNSMLKAHTQKSCKALNSPPPEEIKLGISPPPEEDDDDDEDETSDDANYVVLYLGSLGGVMVMSKLRSSVLF